MKRNLMYGIFMLSLLLLWQTDIFARANLRSTGMGIRGSYWRLNETPEDLVIKNSWDQTQVDLGGGGGWIYFLSRLNETWLTEFSLGAIGEVEVKTERFDGEEVKGSVTTPILFGFRHQLFNNRRLGAFQPYVSLGAGPYWFHNFTACHHEHHYWEDDEEVTVNTKLKAGGYVGGGVNFMLSNWFGLSFDMKHHFINFDVKHPRSGFEYGLGLMFMWGHFDNH